MVKAIDSPLLTLAWFEGKAARADGVPRTAAPHKHDPELQAAWLAGWDDRDEWEVDAGAEGE